MLKTQDLYQILTVEESDDSPSGILTTLYVAPEDYLAKLVPASQDRVPSAGAMLNPDFCSTDNPVDVSARYASQSLLKARKLSQLFAQSWLDEDYCPVEMDIREDDKRRNSVIRKILLTANLEPDAYQTIIPFEEGNDENDDLFSLYQLSRKAQHYGQGLRSRVILPDVPAWRLIRMSLLAAGQVFWKRDGAYERLSEPVLSTYDICVQYAFTEVDWNSYVATQFDMIQPGQNQLPGYYNTSMPYPPRHSSQETNLTPQMVYEWATAPDEGSPWPFYPPKKEDGEYESNLVSYVAPPYPYLTLTCT